MTKFIVISIIGLAFFIAFFMIYRDNTKKVAIDKPEPESEDQQKLEELRDTLETRIHSLDDRTEIAKLQKQIAAIDAKLEKLNN